jgi:hypothetical protein
MTRALCVALVLGPLGGCVYYNAMWSAERFAHQARRAEAAGQEGEARGLWLRAAIKAESVVTRHPQSRWADDAMVLRAEALVRAGSCTQAEPVLARVRALDTPGDLGERVRLAAAECDVAAGRHAAAIALLEPLLASGDASRRARAAYLAGRAAWATGDGARAAVWLSRSRHRAAAGTRVRVLLASGEARAGLALLDTLARGRFVELEWTELLTAAAEFATPAAASATLDNLLEQGRVPPDAAARLLMADGDRRAAAGESPAAAERFAAAAARSPDAATADAARARRLRAQAAAADSVADLERLAAALRRLRGADQRGFTTLLEQMRQPANDIAALRAAELARDSLRAPHLAAQLFLTLPARWPESVFAPKAIVAAMALEPARGDSLLAVLDRAYPSSPYTQALHGLAAPGFAAAEDSLARALGVAVVDRTVGVAVGVLPPRPGPRTVWLEPPVGPTPQARAARPPSRPAQPAAQPTRPPPVERP